MSSLVGRVVGWIPRSVSSRALAWKGLGDPLACRGCGVWLVACDGSIGVELAVECGDASTDFVASSLLVGVGFGGFGELVAGVVEMPVVEELAEPAIETGQR